MRETINEYFTFSKKERTGILILISIVLATAVAPVFFSPKNVGYGDSTVLAEFRSQITLLDAADKYGKRADSISSQEPGKYRDNRFQDYGYNYDNTKYPDKRNPAGAFEAIERNIVLSEFDPNSITVAGWVQLGVSERTAMTIEKYRLKGGRFRKANDILRIYGLSEKDKKRLLPFVKIPADTGKSNFNRLNQGNIRDKADDLFRDNNHQFTRKIPEIIDINTADTSGWSSLPGIGPVLSQRIIKYRDRLGGFYSVEQVAEVYGLHDSVYRKIQAFLTRRSAVRKINLNAATLDILEQHPYLKRQMARAIVDYRSQHGAFKDIGELKQVVSITAELFERISPYISL